MTESPPYQSGPLPGKWFAWKQKQRELSGARFRARDGEADAPFWDLYRF